MKTKMIMGDKVKFARPDVIEQLLNEGWLIDGPTQEKTIETPIIEVKRRGRPSKKEANNG